MKRYEDIKEAIKQHITLMKNTNVRSIQEYLITKNVHITQAEISLLIQEIQTEQGQQSHEPKGESSNG